MGQAIAEGAGDTTRRVAVAAASRGKGILDVLGLGNDSQMYHKAWENRWFPSDVDWEAIGGEFTSPPAAVSWGQGRLDIFGLGNDRQMYHKAWGDNQWSPAGLEWEAIGGSFSHP